MDGEQHPQVVAKQQLAQRRRRALTTMHIGTVRQARELIQLLRHRLQLVVTVLQLLL